MPEPEATCEDRAFSCLCIGDPGHRGPHICACGKNWAYYEEGELAYFGDPRDLRSRDEDA